MEQTALHNDEALAHELPGIDPEKHMGCTEDTFEMCNINHDILVLIWILQQFSLIGGRSDSNEWIIRSSDTFFMRCRSYALLNECSITDQVASIHRRLMEVGFSEQCRTESIHLTLFGHLSILTLFRHLSILTLFGLLPNNVNMDGCLKSVNMDR